jgi:hypothetical protein
LTFFSLTVMSAQVTLWDVQNPATVVLNTIEQTKLSKVQQDITIEANWLVNLKPIVNAVNGRTLSVTFPDETLPTTFEADFPTSYSNGNFNWTGYKLDGSSFRLHKTSEGILGSAYNATSGKHYGILNLSSSKTLIVRYSEVPIKNIDLCDVVGDDEDKDDDSVDDRGGCEINKIRVLFLYTNAALVSSVTSPESASAGIIAEINTACSTSGMSEIDVHFENAGTVLLPSFIEGADVRTDLDNVMANSIAQTLRDDYYADIVVLLTSAHFGFPRAVGVAPLKAKNEEAFCVAELAFAISGFTATHEIGHLLGARHQRCSACDVDMCDKKTNHHGFLIGTTMRTIMAQNSCPFAFSRVGRFSNPDTDLMGFATGDDDNNNSKKIRRRASKVCCFRQEPPQNGSGQGLPFLVSITGLQQVCNTQGYYPYQAVITATPSVVYPVTYIWETSPIGAGNWTQVSTNNSFVLTNPASLPNYLTTLRVTVADGAGNISEGFFEIKRVNCVGDGSSERELDNSVYLSNFKVQVIPNPVSDVLRIKGLEQGSQFSILDTNGHIILQGNKILEVDELTIDFSKFPSGVYFISVRNLKNNLIIKNRFIKI